MADPNFIYKHAIPSGLWIFCSKLLFAEGLEGLYHEILVLQGPHLAPCLFFRPQVKIAFSQASSRASRWLPFDEGASPSFWPPLLGL